MPDEYAKSADEMMNMNLHPAFPEIFLVIAASAILLIDMFVSDAKRHYTYFLSLAASGRRAQR